MKHLLSGVAVIAALAISAPVLAQDVIAPVGFDLGDAANAPSRAPRYPRGRASPQDGASDGRYGQSAEPTRTRPHSVGEFDAAAGPDGRDAAAGPQVTARQEGTAWACRVPTRADPA
jgi:hypothetical protein